MCVAYRSFHTFLFWPSSSDKQWRSKVTIYNVTIIINQKIDSRWEIYQQHPCNASTSYICNNMCSHNTYLLMIFYELNNTTLYFPLIHSRLPYTQHFFLYIIFHFIFEEGKNCAIKKCLYFFPKKKKSFSFSQPFFFTHISERKNISCYQRTLSNIINDEGVVIKLLSMMNFPLLKGFYVQSSVTGCDWYPFFPLPLSSNFCHYCHSHGRHKTFAFVLINERKRALITINNSFLHFWQTMEAINQHAVEISVLRHRSSLHHHRK